MVAEMQKLGSLCFPRRAERTERTVLGGADAVLAVTAVLGELLVAAGARPERVHVVGNGAVPERYGDAARAAAVALRHRWGLAAAAFALGFVGYMRPWHRLDLVLDVMLRPGFEDLVLVLMGRGPALQPLQELAAARGLQARVLALGEVPPDLLPAHVLACDGALIPAINGYASPLKLFDSLAAGVPTVAPDQPNLRETVQHGRTALLFPPGDADALADCLRQLVVDRAFAHRLGAAGRDELLAQHWTWAGNAARVAAIFAGLAGGRA
jgi:glycosyltransferase involved in cell wall biosynthesis